MAKYAVKIVETLSRTVITEAETYDKAVQKVEDAYNTSAIILDADDFDDVGFEVSNTFGREAISNNDGRIKYFYKI